MLEVACLEERALLSTVDADLVTTARIAGAAVTAPVVTNAPSVTVDFSAVDPDEAVGSTLTTQFSVNGGALTTGNTLTLSNEGSYTIQYFSSDATGTETAKTASVTIDRTPPTLTITSVSPTSLWPPNGKMVPVTVTGTVSDSVPGVASTVSATVQNESGYQGGITLPSGPIAVQYTNTNPTGSTPSAGNFTFTVDLQARRFGNDHDGRQYTITVTATDAAGNTSTATTVVTVPHDQGHGHGGSSGGGGGSGSGTGTGQGHGHGHGHGQNSGGGDNQGEGHGNGNGNGNGHGHGHNHGNGNGHGNGNDQGNGQGNGNGHGHGHGNGG